MESDNKMGYKAFEKGMVCRGKQYHENTDYEESGAESCCKAGVMHYCEEPFDCWDYYPVVDDGGNFTEYAEVKPLAEVLKSGKKRASKKLHIGAKLSLKDFIKAEIDFIFAKEENVTQGNNSRSVTQGYCSRAVTQGNDSRAVTQGNDSRAVTQGDLSRAVTQGNNSLAVTQGDCSRAVTQGNNSRSVTQGYCSRAVTQGNNSLVVTQGYNSLAVTQGDCSRAVTQGDCSRAVTNGRNSIAVGIGAANKAKTKLGSWIVLAEWEKNDAGEYVPICVKSAQIDGKKLKADTWYMLENGEFVEAREDD